MIYGDVCARSRYQGHEQIITSHCYCAKCFLIGLDPCLFSHDWIVSQLKLDLYVRRYCLSYIWKFYCLRVPMRSVCRMYTVRKRKNVSAVTLFLSWPRKNIAIQIKVREATSSWRNLAMSSTQKELLLIYILSVDWWRDRNVPSWGDMAV